MRKSLKKVLVGFLVSFSLIVHLSFINLNYVYADTNNKNTIEQKHNNKNGISKEKVFIGVGIILAVLVVGRIITPKEAFAPLKKNKKK